MVNVKIFLKSFLFLISFSEIVSLRFFVSLITLSGNFKGKLKSCIIELISVLVISERFVLDIGLPFRYRIASPLVTRSISGNFLEIR